MTHDTEWSDNRVSETVMAMAEAFRGVGMSSGGWLGAMAQTMPPIQLEVNDIRLILQASSIVVFSSCFCFNTVHLELFVELVRVRMEEAGIIESKFGFVGARTSVSNKNTHGNSNDRSSRQKYDGIRGTNNNIKQNKTVSSQSTIQITSS